MGSCASRTAPVASGPDVIPPSLPQGAAPALWRSASGGSSTARQRVAPALRIETARADDVTLGEPSAQGETARLRPALSKTTGDAQLAMSALDRVRRLQSVIPFVLDNSVRETTVGQIRGHTLADKYAITQQVMDAGCKHQVIATFTKLPSVDDRFCQELRLPVNVARFAGQQFYAFAELRDDVIGGIPLQDTPLGLQRCATYGIPNVIIELDLLCKLTNWGVVTMSWYCSLIGRRVDWIREHCSPTALIFINIRDFVDAWIEQPLRVESVIAYLAELPEAGRIAGVMLEDPSGAVMPFDMAVCVSRTRLLMQDEDWDGHLLVHVHNAFGLAEAVVQDALAAGANGVWAGICREGAACGHANSLTTLFNLHRLGNPHVAQLFNLPRMRQAAIEITRITTGELPHPMMELYGSRALDIVFDGSMAADPNLLPDIFKIPAKVRVSSLTTPAMMAQKLTDVFGSPGPAGWPKTIGAAMLQRLIQDLNEHRKEEYDSLVGFCSLYERAGGVFTPAMRDVMTRDAQLETGVVIQQLLDYCRQRGIGDARFGVDADVALSRRAFYEGFLAKYVSSYDRAEPFLRLFDLNGDGVISWSELLWRAKWAVTEYPENCATVDGLLSTLVEKYIMPEIVSNVLASPTAEHRRNATLVDHDAMLTHMLSPRATAMRKPSGARHTHADGGGDPVAPAALWAITSYRSLRTLPGAASRSVLSWRGAPGPPIPEARESGAAAAVPKHSE